MSGASQTSTTQKAKEKSILSISKLEEVKHLRSGLFKQGEDAQLLWDTTR